MYSIKNENKSSENNQDREDDVWIDCNVTILKGVKIGKRSASGARFVVNKHAPSYIIQAGVSDVKQFPRFSEEDIKEHEERLNNKKL